jgi:uncharacterized damage-inducible protein DinB
MSTTLNPYQADLGTRNPLEALGETPARIQALVAQMNASDLARSYAPGKWTAAQLLVHLAQSELALTNRARMALSEPGYVAQPFDQDRWMARESASDGERALAAYLALREWNLQLFRSLSPADRATGFRHPEYGELTVDWLLAMIAGHELHHLPQFQMIASSR